MSYTELIQTLANRSATAAPASCYRDDALRAIAQDDFSAMLNMLNKSSSTEPTHHYLDQLNLKLQDVTNPALAEADRACLPAHFDQCYQRALASCDSFAVQKQLANLSVLGLRLDIAASLAGLDAKHLNAELVSATANQALQKEWHNFVQHSQQLAKQINNDMSRHPELLGWQTSLTQLGSSLLANLAIVNSGKSLQETRSPHHTPGVRHGN